MTGEISQMQVPVDQDGQVHEHNDKTVL